MTDTQQKTYLVRVGHAEVEVRAENEMAAIEAGRRQLCSELPRMWDIISRLDKSRFEIELVVDDEANGRDVA